MKRGHVSGEKKERRGAQDWFAAIEAANLRQVEEAAMQEQQGQPTHAATEPRERK